MAEPPIDRAAVSGLKRATEAIRAAFDAWFVNWAEATTIIHPGRVTPNYLAKQAGHAPRIIVSAQRGESGSETLGFGKQVNITTTFLVFLVLPGTIEDRTVDALNVIALAYNFVLANPWVNKDDPDCPFATSVKIGTAEWETVYGDVDENTGLSMWLIKWDQVVDNGTAAQTPDPIGLPLESITIDNRTEPEPDGETIIETEVA